MKKEKERSLTIVQRLGVYLADSVVLSFKTLNYHWNMVGPQFFMYHKLLEEQYKELVEANDVIAERIRMIGPKAPGTMRDFLALATLKEGKASLSQDKMVADLVADHTAMVANSHALIELSDSIKDQATSDMTIDRLRAHDKSAWLLKSHLLKK